MRYCKRCVQPDTRPGIYFNDDGICGACLHEDDVDKNIDWVSREKELQEMADWAKKTTKAPWDCAIGVSGGKDSTFQALYAREKLGLRVLLVNSEPEGISAIGSKNIENLISKGFDTIKIRPNPIVIKKLMKRDFYKYLNPVKVTEYSLWSSTYIIADKFDIPMIIQGENPGLTLGVRKTGVGTDGNALNAEKLDTLSEPWRAYVDDSIDEKDMFVYHYDRESMENKGIKGIWLQYYTKEWSPTHNVKFSQKNGLNIREDFNPEDIGTYIGYSQMDSDLVQVNQLLKYVKFGFGQCTDHACYDMRIGNLTRDKAIELVRKYDGRCSEGYIKAFCDTIGISIDEFWKVTDTFRGPMWKKDQKGNWILKSPIWEQFESAV
ncbi:MAG: N-acetyl sugar amidotransferase [Candidatus Tantalella remota]|nr:N-acetyl sugar amidotransferase [Candidatus Tantalella remota]